MVIVGHMSSKSAFGAKNTGQKFLTPKNFWWCRNVCHDSCPGVIFGAGRGGAAPSFSGVGRGGAGQSWKFSGPGRPGAAISPGAGAGRGGACIPAVNLELSVALSIYLIDCKRIQHFCLSFKIEIGGRFVKMDTYHRSKSCNKRTQYKSLIPI